MTPPDLDLKFLTDENVPMSVNRFLQDRGFDVMRSDDVCAPAAPDPIVASAAMESGRILVSWDRDFNHQRFMKPRFRRLSRIAFACPEHRARTRIEEIFDLLNSAFQYCTCEEYGILIRIALDKLQVRDKRLD